jgi:hypothetical protein
MQEKIDGYFEWVRDQRKEIDKFPERFRRILLLSLLDSLSKCAFPKEGGNKRRFVNLIDQYSGWKHKDCVSLPQLRYLLIKTGSCANLLRHVQERMNEWFKGRILRPEESDLRLNELENLKCSACEDLIEKARYASLLWQMRNFAVHEFRRAGEGMAAISDDHSSPYYHGCLEPDGSFRSWELYVPSEVISQVVQKCSDNLEKKLRSEGRDPYDAFSYGSSWYP